LGFVDVVEVAGAVAVAELLEVVPAPDELAVADWVDDDALVWAVAEACGFCAAAPVLDALLPDVLAPAAEFAGLVELSAGFVLVADSAGFGDVVPCD
jgi:hypothetical protein